MSPEKASALDKGSNQQGQATKPPIIEKEKPEREVIDFKSVSQNPKQNS